MYNHGDAKTVTFHEVWRTDHSGSAEQRIPIEVATRTITVPAGGAATIMLRPPTDARCEPPLCWTMAHYAWPDVSGGVIELWKPCSPGHP